MSDDSHFVDTYARIMHMNGVVTEEDTVKNDFGDNHILMWPNECIVPNASFAFIKILNGIHKCDCCLVDASITIKQKLVDLNFHLRDFGGATWFKVVEFDFYDYIIKNNIGKGNNFSTAFNCAILTYIWNDRRGEGCLELSFKNHFKRMSITDKSKRPYETTTLEDFVKERIEKEKENT